MRLAQIGATGFRNLSGFVPLHSGVAVVVGENNAGKSNLIDACRLLFDPEVGPSGRLWITKSDFAHDGQGNRVTDTFELEAVFADLNEAERARMVTCLAPSRGPDSARLRLRATLASGERIHTEWFGGDSSHPDIERWAREAVTFTYLHPLRDAASDLRPGRANRLGALVGALAPEGHEDRQAIEQIMKTANDNLGDIPSIGEARNRVQQHLLGLTGDGRLRQSSDLIFAEPKFDKVVATLRALVGSFGPVEVTESGLGYSNLLYMSVLLAALEEETEAALRLLLIEEPEAHLHPQLQDLLMRFLEKTGSAGSQVVITTHSPNLASGAKVERLTVLSRRAADMTLVGRCVGDFGLAPTHLEHLRRFLDVTKSGLLFARGVILVEGIAEQLLVPVIAERLGISLTQAGIAVVNVGGIAFRPFIELFGDDKLPFPCAVISDSDPTNDDVQDEDEESDVSSNSSEEASAAVVDGQGGQPQPIEADGAVSGSTTSEADTESESAITEADQEAAANLSPAAKILRGLENEHLKVFLADRTLEWDLVRVGNWNVLLDALKRVKPRVAARLRRDHADSAPEARADVLLDKVKDRKGRFAQELAAIIGEAPEFEVPGYIRQAIDWVSRDDFGGSEPTQDDGPDLPRPEAEDDSAQGPDDVLDAPT